MVLTIQPKSATTFPIGAHQLIRHNKRVSPASDLPAASLQIGVGTPFMASVFGEGSGKTSSQSATTNTNSAPPNTLHSDTSHANFAPPDTLAVRPMSAPSNPYSSSTSLANSAPPDTPVSV